MRLGVHLILVKKIIEVNLHFQNLRQIILKNLLIIILMLFLVLIYIHMVMFGFIHLIMLEMERMKN